MENENVQETSFNDFNRKIFNCKIVQIEMMAGRGYEIPENEASMLELDEDDVEGFSNLALTKGKSIREGISHTYLHVLTGKKCMVYWHYEEGLTKEVGAEVARYLLTNIIKDSLIDTLILITNTKVSSTAYSELRTIPSYQVQHFMLSALSSNPLKSFLSPKYKVISREEFSKLTNGEIDPLRLPLMIVVDLKYGGARVIVGDPAGKFLGLTDGSIVMVTRVNWWEETCVKESIAFRLVKSV